MIRCFWYSHASSKDAWNCLSLSRDGRAWVLGACSGSEDNNKAINFHLMKLKESVITLSGGIWWERWWRLVDGVQWQDPKLKDQVSWSQSKHSECYWVERSRKQSVSCTAWRWYQLMLQCVSMPHLKLKRGVHTEIWLQRGWIASQKIHGDWRIHSNVFQAIHDLFKKKCTMSYRGSLIKNIGISSQCIPIGYGGCTWL